MSGRAAVRPQPFPAAVGDHHHRAAGSGDIAGIDGVLPDREARAMDNRSVGQRHGAQLQRLVDQLASESEYFHTPTDANAGRA